LILTTSGRPRPVRSHTSTSAFLALLLLAACAPATERPDDEDDGSGGATDEGGRGGGGRVGGGGKASGGSGGKASGGTGGKATGGTPAEGGSGDGGAGGSGGKGSGGSGTGGMLGSGGTGAGGAGSGGTPGGDPDCPKTNPPGFCTIQLYLVNCIFCHTGAANQKRVNLSEGPGLRERIVSKPIVAPELANCPIKTLIVPGKPEESLLYRKIAGTMPDGCGKLMPDKEAGQVKPPPRFTADELKLVFDWIAGGAVP
jgi:hypothetical protein